jgi:hypothetical protein
MLTINSSTISPQSVQRYQSAIGKATHHAQLALPSRLWRIEVRYLCAHVRPVNSDSLFYYFMGPLKSFSILCRDFVTVFTRR